MNYVVFDLEFNQGYKYKRKNRSRVNPKCRFEIIQIGAVKLDKNLKTIGQFDKLVKPQVYNCIHHFIAEMTNITEEKLAGSAPFNQVYKDFIDFIGDGSILCTWGVSDMRELVGNITYHKLDKLLLPEDYIDIQSLASKYLNTPHGNSIGLKNAVTALKLPLDSDFHDAFNDAYYTAEIFKEIYTDDIETTTYNLNQDTTSRKSDLDKKKIRVNNAKLISQFEKMFDRNMTKEEEKIIKLAFNMGMTGQFQSTTTVKIDEKP